MAAINNSAAAENPTSKKSKVDELGDDNYDPFERLSDETIIEILVRVNYEKSRRRCVALNKRMSCLVPLTEPIYIDIPLDPWITDSTRNRRYHCNNVKIVRTRFLPGESELPVELVFRVTRYSYASVEEIIQYYIKTASECLRSRRPVVGAPIQHVTVKLDKTVDYSGVLGALINGAWNLEYSGVEGALIKSFALLGYLHYCIPINYRIEMIARCMRFGAILQPMVEQLVRDHETLCRVTIVSECGQGRLHMSPEEISKMRRWMNNNNNKKKKKIINDGILSSMKLNIKTWRHAGIVLVLVTDDPESHHTSEDVKIVIDSVLDRSVKNIEKDNIEKMRRMMMKDKEKLPPCSFEVTNSEWHWES